MTLLNFVACSAPGVTLWLGGDVHLGDGGAPVLFHEGGIGIVNLEGPVGAAVDPPRLHNAATALPQLRDAGVRVVGVVNNHAGDFPGDLDAIASAGLVPAGMAILEEGGLRIVVTAHDLPHEGLASELRDAKARGDVLVSTFHVTGPPSYLPRPELEQAVAIALAAGADVIAAHGTHVVGPVERRDGAVIAWGLGNLAFQCRCTDETDAILLRVHLPDLRAEIVPIEAGLNGRPARLSPDPEGVFRLLEAIGSTPL